MLLVGVFSTLTHPTLSLIYEFHRGETLKKSCFGLEGVFKNLFFSKKQFVFYNFEGL